VLALPMVWREVECRWSSVNRELPEWEVVGRTWSDHARLPAHGGVVGVGNGWLRFIDFGMR
jgi:hypothetical protein